MADKIDPSNLLRFHYCPRVVRKVFSVLWDHVPLIAPTPKIFAAVVGLWLLELLAATVDSGGFIRNQGLNFFVLAGLAGLSLIVWLAIAWLGYWLLGGLRLVRQQFAGQQFLHRMIRVAVDACTVSWGTIAAGYYCSAWYFFYKRLGVFPNTDAIRFSFINSRMLLSHFLQTEPRLVRFLCVSLCITAMSAAYFLRQFQRGPATFSNFRFAHSVRGAVVVVVATNALVCFTVFGRVAENNIDYRDRIQVVVHPWASCWFELQYHINPVITLAVTAPSIAASDVGLEFPLDDLRALEDTATKTLSDGTDRSLPDIVLVTVESLRSDAVLASHQGREVMPQMASLCKAGAFFPNCYANSTHSDYSDPAILSGLYPLRTEDHHYYSKNDPWPRLLIYDYLKRLGYSTAIVSSQNETWSNMHLFYESPDLDYFFDSRSQPDETSDESSYMRYWLSRTHQTAGKLNDALTMSHAIEWIRARRDGPFFVSINLQSSHFPYSLPDGAEPLFRPCDVNVDVSLLDYPQSEQQALRNSYFNALTYVDSQIGRLMKVLEERESGRNFILVVTGDHGEGFGENGVSGHGGAPSEITTRVGLLIHSPRLVEPSADPYLAESVDIAPTIAALVGISECPSFQGVNVLSRDRPLPEERTVFIHSNNASACHDGVFSGVGWRYSYDIRQQRGVLYFPNSPDPHKSLERTEREIAAVFEGLRLKWRQRQLAYYGHSRYYLLFWPPKPPAIGADDCQQLVTCAKKLGFESNAGKKNVESGQE